MSVNTGKQKSFVDHLGVSFDVWENLQDDFFESIAFKEWPKNEHSWQLRVVGPPGCGKTTVSALTERWLRANYSDQNVKIACVYFQSSEQVDHEKLLPILFSNILSQLTDGVDLPERPGEGMSLAELRVIIQQRIAHLDHVFLLVDDIDLCSSVMLSSLEKELKGLQKPNLSIMVTSRVPHVYDAERAACDTHKTNSEELVYWRCRRCEVEQVLEEGHSHKVICQACKIEGKSCLTCGQNDSLYEPYSHILYHLNSFTAIPQFVARELELAHGDLGLESDVVDKPPLSALGRALGKSKPLLGEELRDDIVRRSDKNVSLAKARLGFYFNARTMEDVTRVGDRLPDPFIALFEAFIDRINHETFDDRELGLLAVLAVALRFDNPPFSELENWLQSMSLLEADPPENDEHNLLRTLRATCGLLTVDHGKEKCIRLYSDFLIMFVEQNYSSTLFSLRHRVETQQTLQKAVNGDEA